MRNITYFLLLLLCFFNSKAQVSTINNNNESKEINSTSGNIWAKITFPVNGTVFQKQVGGVEIDFSGQYLNPIVGRYILKIYKRDNSTGNYSLYSTTDIFDVNSSTQNIVQLGSTQSRSFLFQPITTFLEGWYKAIIFLGTGGTNPVSTVSFGVGDVYYIAGQSNASGFNYHNPGDFSIANDVVYKNNDDFDPTLPIFLNNDFSILSRVYNKNGKYEWNLNQPQSDDYNYKKPVNGIWNGLPFKNEFAIFKNGTDRKVDAMRMYPNGMASWNWAPLGYKIATIKGTPTIFFNLAFPGSWIGNSSGGWAPENVNTSNNERKKFLQALSLYGGIIGAKSVLWHQGEEDSYHLTNGEWASPYNPENYKINLESLISDSRSIFENTNQLSWYVSKVSRFSGGTLSPANLPGVIPPTQILGLFGTSLDGSASKPVITNSYTHSAITGKQQEILNNTSLVNVFPGLIYSDDIQPSSRDSKYRIHFSGDQTHNGLNTLKSVADQWYDAIYSGSNYQNAQGIGPNRLVRLMSVSGSGSSYTLTYQIIQGASYLFVKNDNGIYHNSNVKSFENDINSTSSNSYTFSGINSGDVLTCYIKEPGSNRFKLGQQFYAIGGTVSDKQLIVKTPSFNVSSYSQTVLNEIKYNNVEWSINTYNNSWITASYQNGDFEQIKVDILPNTGTSSRTATITLQESGGGLSSSFTVFQSGSSYTSLPLTSLNPTNSSTEWYANFNGTSIGGGGSLNIGGTIFTQGIGAHADSRIVYNVAGLGYQTFLGKFGIDEESNCGDGVIFSIKADGVTVFGPISKSHGQAPTIFTVPISNKSTLELISSSGANINCDHADWADLYLQTVACSTPPPAPTNVTANPSSISSGSSSLSANCSIGIPVWNTGQTGTPVNVNPAVTTNYTVSCQSSDCPPSNSTGVTVSVTGSCTAVSDNLTMGTWTVTGHPLVARYFHNQYWLTQRIGNNPDSILVRASEMLTRGDVNLNNPSFSGMIGCFAWPNSNFGGLQPPSSTVFPTPSGYSLNYESDNTPFYISNNSGCQVSSPINVIATPGGISSGQSSLLSASCPSGTSYLWSTGATIQSISVSPTNTTTYNVKCKQAGCTDSPTVNVTVNVGPCNDMVHNLVLGTWNAIGHPLVVKEYNSQKWLVQRISSNLEKFLVRGSEMLNRSDVTLNNPIYASKVGCFAWQYSNFGGLQTPPTSDPGGGGIWFQTPSGWILGLEPDYTPFYTSIGGGRIGMEELIASSEKEPSFLLIFPNPASESVNLKVNLKNEDKISIDLINSSGQIYRSLITKGKIGENFLKFNLEGIKGGHYLIRVKSTIKTESLPLVID